MYKITIFILLFGMFSVLNSAVLAQNADLEILKAIHSVDASFGYSRVVSNSTTAVSVGVPVVMGAMALIYKDDVLMKNSLFVVAAMGVDGVLTYSLKRMIARPRPYASYPDQIQPYSYESSYSMPSGHTSLAFVTAASLSMKYPQWYVVVPAFCWAGSVAYSRMNLGVHYPSDVLAGAALGVGSAWVSSKVNDWYWQKRGQKALISAWEKLPTK